MTQPTVTDEDWTATALWYDTVERGENTVAALAELFAAHRLLGQRQGIEMAAKVADSTQSTDTDWDTSYWNQACNAVAMAIRDLAPEASVK